MKKKQATDTYQTSQQNIDDTKANKSGITMESKLTINSRGNYELTEYNTTYKMQVTLEFLGTADSEQLEHEIQQTLKNQYLEKLFHSNKNKPCP